MRKVKNSLREPRGLQLGKLCGNRGVGGIRAHDSDRFIKRAWFVSWNREMHFQRAKNRRVEPLEKDFRQLRLVECLAEKTELVLSLQNEIDPTLEIAACKLHIPLI